MSILTVKSFFKGFIVSSIVAILLLFFSKEIIGVLINEAVEKEKERVKNLINEDLDLLSNQTREFIKQETISPLLLKKNTADMFIFLADEQKNKGIDFIHIVDQNGNIIIRTDALSFRGDNIFQTTPWGDEFSKKKFLKSVEKTKIFPLTLITGDLLSDGDQTIGGLFAGLNIDNKYAEKIKKRINMDSENHIIFYSTEEEKIAGTTVTDIDTIKALGTYSNSASGIKNVFTNLKEVKIKDQYYIVENIPLYGVDGRSGEILLIFKNPHLSEAIILSFIIAMVFFIYTMHQHKKNKKDNETLITTTIMLVVFVSSLLFINHKLAANVSTINNLDGPINFVSMSLFPESDVIDMALKHPIEIHVSSEKEIIDAIQTSINYDPNKIKVDQIITAGSICDKKLIIENIDKKIGHISLACAVAKPGFYGLNGLIAKIIIQPLATGNFNLHLTQESKVLSNDGSNLNILKELTSGFYKVIDSRGGSNLEPLLVFSYSHPNSNRWYQEKIIKLSWPQYKNCVYMYAFNKEANYIPNNDQITQNNKVTLEAESDNVYYFHLLPLKNNSGYCKSHNYVSHFKINIDSTPPDIISLSTNNEEIKTGNITRFNINSEDNLSGIRNNHYIKINNGTFFPVKNYFEIPFLESGHHKIMARVFDNAGNFKDGEIVLKVQD